MKKCSRCQQVKPLEEFSIKDKGKRGAICKACAAEKNREWYAENKELISLKRSVQNLNCSLNLLRRKAHSAGFGIKIEYTNQFVVTMEKL